MSAPDFTAAARGDVSAQHQVKLYENQRTAAMQQSALPALGSAPPTNHDVLAAVAGHPAVQAAAAQPQAAPQAAGPAAQAIQAHQGPALTDEDLKGMHPQMAATIKAMKGATVAQMMELAHVYAPNQMHEADPVWQSKSAIVSAQNNMGNMEAQHPGLFMDKEGSLHLPEGTPDAEGKALTHQYMTNFNDARRRLMFINQMLAYGNGNGGS
jgi:hypothetical protein